MVEEEIDVPHVPVFAVTLVYLGTTLLLMRFLRSLLQRSSNKYLHIVADDTLSSFQAIACSLENFATKRVYGNTAFVAQLFFLGIWHGSTMIGCGNACGNFCLAMRRKQSAALTFLKVLFQLVGGGLAWFYAKYVWSYGFSLPHVERFAIVSCQTDLNTDIWKACLIEMGGAIFLMTIVRMKSVPLTVMSALDSLVTLAGVHLTGMYYNPVNASIQTFGCHGTTYPQFFLIYWLSPFVGCCIATVVDGYRKRWGKKDHKVKQKLS